MKKIVLLSLLFATVSLLAYTSADWNEVDVRFSRKENMLFFTKNGQQAGCMIIADNGRRYSPEWVDFTIADGKFTLDTRRLHAENPNAVVFFKFSDLPHEDLQGGKKYFREVAITSEPEGRQIHFILEGYENAPGGGHQHTWIPGTSLIKSNGTTRLEDYFPEKDYAGMQPTIQFYQPGIYHIGRVKCGFVEEKKTHYDATQNLLINGDAEAGFQYTAAPCAPMCKAYDGKSRNHVEQAMSSLPRYTVDTEVAHTGKASFRIEADEKPIGPFEWFSFTPIKYILREPLTFSVWMKSAQDDFPVYIAIRMSTWKAYQTQVRVSRQWQKYSITIPSFGDPAPGLECYSVQQVLKEELCYGFPQVIMCEPGTLWLDDAPVFRTIFGRGIHKVDPDAKVAGPTPVPTSPSYIAAVLEHDGSSELNVVTEHAYRKLPELPDYGADITIVCENIRKQGKKMPVWSTESCLETPALLPYETIPADVVETAARDIRIPLVGFANGLERYYHFATSVLAQPATTFLDCILGGPETDGLPRPGLYLYAARALIDLIGDAPCTERVRLGADCRGYIFDNGKERVAAVWKWDGDPLTVTLPQDIVVYDMMGQEREPGSVTLSTRPHYLKSTFSAMQLCKVLEESMSRHGAAKCEFSIKVIDEMRVAVEVSNRGAAVLAGTLSINDNGLLSEQPGDIAIQVAGESTQSIELHLGQPLAVKAPKLQFTLRTTDGQVIEQSLPVSALLVPHSDITIKNDGDLADWPTNAASLKLDYTNHVTSAKEQWTAEEKAITAEIRMYWNEKSLNIAFILNKPVFMPYSGEKETFWEGDSIQFVLDALKNARPDTMELQDDDYVYCLAGNAATPIVQREVASSPMHDSLVKEIGRIKEVSLGIKAEHGRVIYEASFPTRAVSPLLLAPGRTAGFSAIFNLTDGQSRIGWLEVAPGVGQWPRSPAKYLTIILKK
jgi:hypothetical protein